MNDKIKSTVDINSWRAKGKICDMSVPLLDEYFEPLPKSYISRAELLLQDVYKNLNNDEVLGLMFHGKSIIIYTKSKIEFSESEKWSIEKKHSFDSLIFTRVTTDLKSSLLIALGIDRKHVNPGLNELKDLPPGSPTR